MRPTVFSALALTTLVLAACGGTSPTPAKFQRPPPLPPNASTSATATPVETTPLPPPPKPPLSEVMPEAIRGIYDASNAHDVAKEASYLSDDFVVSFYGTSETHGKAAFVEGATKSTQLWSDMKFTPTRIWMKGNVAVVEFIWTGTWTGALPGDTAKFKGAAVGAKRADVYVFDDDGRAREQRIYLNRMGVKAQRQGDKNAPPIEPVPTGTPELHVAKGTADEDKLVDWAKKIQDALDTHDVAQVTPLLADDLEYETWGVRPIKGKKDNVQDLQRFFKAFPDQKWTPINLWGSDGFVVIEGVFTGTQKMPYGQFTKVTGKPVTGQHFLQIWQPNADGKLVHVWSYWNPIEAQQQAGAAENTQPR